MFSATPFALQNSAHSAALFRQAVSSLVPPGGGLVNAGDLTVSATGTPSMNVSVGVGRCWIPGTNVGNVTGGNFSSQAMYYGQNESAYTASVATADSINPRIDVVYAAVQDSQYAGTTNAGVLAVVAGVPTSGASYPANAPTIPANAIPLAWINVAANASSITSANITQLGTMAPWRGATPHEEWTYSNPANTVPNATGWGPGLGTLDAANSIYPGFGSTPANDIFQVSTAGRYTFHWYAVLGGSAGAPVYMSIRNNNSGSTYTSHQWPSAFEHDISVTLSLPANAQIKLVYVQTSGATYNAAINHRLRVTKVG
ncbi:hypothetical protein ACFFGR_09100 [Arthrobacter liuii]|uniref:Uncharacterized protein n=1 Tax=Arthrobacter liuii TaxID=1476996 RepID=A0ABQ2ALQ5_9MICC|nr:hypothetical protein [Arthrobacter liuii]GGH93703.1 hypothetical protein GCM10007170_15190 [Arthrobacter liuii]